MKIPGKASERGQALTMALVLAVLVVLMGAGLIRMHQNHMKHQADSKQRDRIFSVGDAALGRAMSVLTAGSATSELWSVADNIEGYKSLTATNTAFTDIPGARYWIKIMMGDLADTTNAHGADNDAAVAQWQNTGDADLDRTIFVRVVEAATNREDVFYAVLHRNDQTYIPGGKGIETTGCMDLGNSWSGDTFTSCNGPYGGTNHSGPGGTVANGSVQSPCISGGGSGFTLTKNQATVSPPPPSSINFLNQETNVHGNATADITANTTVGTNWPSFYGGGAYKIDDFSTTGNKTIQIDTSRGFVHIYVHGTLSLGGNIDLLVISPTARMVVDSFVNTWNYNRLGTNALALGTSGTAHNQHLAVTQTGGLVYLRLTPTAAGLSWHSLVGASGGTGNLLGYRNLNFRAKGDAGGEKVSVGMVVRQPGTTNETTTTTEVTLTSAWADYVIPFASVMPSGLTYSPEAFSRRIILTGLSAGAKASFDDFSVSRYGGTYCCNTEDAVIYEMNGNDVTLSGNGDYQCLLYCPDSDVSVQGGGNGYFRGAIIAKSFSTSGGGAGWFNYDSCLAKGANEAYQAPPIIMTTWRQVGRKF